jgi:PelA/Pel-15E family pectate lyase
MKALRRALAWIAVALFAGLACARAQNPRPPDAGDVQSNLPISAMMRLPDTWFQSEAARPVLENVLSHQSLRGDWPKGIHTPGRRSTQSPDQVQGTFDNGATTGELRLMARAYRLTKKPEYEASFLRGLDHVLHAQYPNGGWPQMAPPPAGSYHRHITFNDGTMVRLMELARDVGTLAEFAFVDSSRRSRARAAFDRAVDCVLRSQIVVKGRKTAWCAQHDEVTLAPRPGRSYELVSLSGAESAGVLLLLMSLEKPSAEVREAIIAGAAWFESAALAGVREVRVEGDKRLLPDPHAPPLWARFYEIETNRPFYCGRDGSKKYNLSEIEAERRNGYSWHGKSGELVRQAFSQWAQRQSQ